MSRKVYQEVMNKKLRLSQNFEILRSSSFQYEISMPRTPSITDIDGILVGHHTLRKRPTGVHSYTARKPFVAAFAAAIIRGVLKAKPWGPYPAAADYPGLRSNNNQGR